MCTTHLQDLLCLSSASTMKTMSLSSKKNEHVLPIGIGNAGAFLDSPDMLHATVASGVPFSALQNRCKQLLLRTPASTANIHSIERLCLVFTAEKCGHEA